MKRSEINRKGMNPMNQLLGGILLAVGLLAGAGTGWAETIQGTVVSIDPSSSSLKLSRANPATGIPETVRVLFLKGIRLHGAKELQPGARVEMDVIKGPGVFGTKDIQILKKARNVDPASA